MANANSGSYNMITLRNVRLSYNHLVTPSRFDEATKQFVDDPVNGHYSVRLIIPKDSEAAKILSAAVKALKDEALAAGIRTQGNKVAKITSNDLLRFSSGVHDGDTADDDALLGAVFATPKANAEHQPACYDENNNRIDPEKLYPGCYANVCIRPYAYCVGSNLGGSFTLIALQFAGDGERLGSSVNTDSIFGDAPAKPGAPKAPAPTGLEGLL